MRNIKFTSIKTGVVFIILQSLLLSCSKDFLDKQPLDQLSSSTFWKTEGDAMMGLTACYHVEGAQLSAYENFQLGGLIILDGIGGLGSDKEDIEPMANGSLTSVFWVVEGFWDNYYNKIALCNNFIKNVETCNMDAAKKTTMIAEARFIRAYAYLNLGFYFGNVPLIISPITVDEANTVLQSTQEQVITFAEEELTAIINDLPKSRPDSESGRITKGAALAILGRAQMWEKKWSDAALTYKSIIDLNEYIIDPDYLQLFWEMKENSKEIIWSTQYAANISPNENQLQFRMTIQGGYHGVNAFNSLVKMFECTDGKTIDESPLYDPNNPYENRDPRLDYSVVIPNRTVLNGMLYKADPYSNDPDAVTLYPWTGLAPRKYIDENYYPGDERNYGGNVTIVRYAEVLLSYLESLLESGTAITQGILDNSINLIRGRAAVNMPSITETDQSKLREIIRRERVCELNFEGLRYYDILRWGIADVVNNNKFYGMKLTNDPANYTLLPVDDEGYYFYRERNYKKGINELWPIPLSELDINENLIQNFGY